MKRRTMETSKQPSDPDMPSSSPLSIYPSNLHPKEFERHIGRGMQDMETSQINDAPGNEEEEEEEVEMSGEFVVHRAPIRPSSINDTLDEEDDDEDAEEEDGEETIDMSGQFILHRAPIHPYRFGDVHDGNSMFGFGDLDRAIEPERSTRASSEASTIPLDYSTTRPRAPFPAPSHALSIASLPLKSALPPSLQEWRYRDATLPDTLPRTIGQWAKLEHKVRMITPLPNAEKPERVSEVTIREVRRRYDEMWVRDQKRVCEVVRKSWVEGEDVVEFLTGNDKKSQQIYWSNLTPQCVRNVKTIIEHIEYEDFDRELAEVGTWKADDGEFKAVKADDNFYGVGWERKGSRGKFSGGEDNLMGWHDLVWPKKPENDPLLVLQDTGKGENPRPVRMQLKDGEEGTKKKKKPAAKPKLGQSKRGRLVGGQPGTWGFWTAPEDRNLRDWILSAQGDGFGA